MFSTTRRAGRASGPPHGAKPSASADMHSSQPPCIDPGQPPTNLAPGTCQSGIKGISIQVGADFLTVTRSILSTFTRLNALTALAESILSIIAIAALAAGLLMNS